MVPELEKARITEIHVRMDCHGCVQKIKKALHGINGIYNISIDFAQQKLTVVGWADPEKIIKAIKKTRKIATICSHKEVDPPAPPPDPAPADVGDPPPPRPEAPPPTDPPASDNQPAPPPAEPLVQAEPETPAPKEETTPTTAPAPAAADKPPTETTKDVEEIHVVQHQPAILPPYDHIYYSGGGHGFRQVQQAVPYHVVMTHNYNIHQPSSSISEYELYQRPATTQYIRHETTDQYVDGDYDFNYNGRDRRDGNQITSIFSDENPNACIIA